MLNTLKNKVKKFFNKDFDKISISISEVKNMKFKIYNNIERYRIEKFGGEKNALEYFINTIEKDDIVIDVGASVGLYSVAIAKYKNTKFLYAFEPDLETFRRLNENLKLNKLSNYKTFQLALSDKETVSKLYTNGTNGFAPSLIFQKDREGAPSNTIEIETKRLDYLIENKIIEIPDNIKVDIEGAEILFLKGAEKTLSGAFGKKPRSIFIEIHPEFLPLFNSSEDTVRNILLNYSYQLIWESKRDNQIHTHWVLS